jgi:hypothetical protein
MTRRRRSLSMAGSHLVGMVKEADFVWTSGKQSRDEGEKCLGRVGFSGERGGKEEEGKTEVERM